MNRTMGFSALRHLPFARRIGRSLGIRLSPAPITPGEQPADHYDRVYASSLEYARDYRDSRYYFVWTVLADRVNRLPARSVLEIGCGSGQFAHLLFDRGIRDYLGIDFSVTAIDAARVRVPELRFEVGDARSSAVITSRQWDCVVCTEVLEHIADDRLVISRWAAGTYCLCTVPDFDDESHVRYFDSEAAVAERYLDFFDEFSVCTFRAPGEKRLRYFLFDGYRNERVVPDMERRS